MRGIKVNEVWMTHAGNYVIIVNSSEHLDGLAMLWYDPVDKDLNVGRIMSRLSCKTNLTPMDAMKIWQNFI